ncbi:hypothetical protein I7I51_06980 [Histoplasma capsulatum]|uniref:Uncharacterized protein n=1 Tax=Ajellomyces capsulatus TaxID=5037 RepID=A0A8A1MJQ5_AJECA|nr:hypothetical protein I7I51_06980 [Histoplasma capsulatum]
MESKARSTVDDDIIAGAWPDSLGLSPHTLLRGQPAYRPIDCHSRSIRDLAARELQNRQQRTVDFSRDVAVWEWNEFFAVEPQPRDGRSDCRQQTRNPPPAISAITTSTPSNIPGATDYFCPFSRKPGGPSPTLGTTPRHVRKPSLVLVLGPATCATSGFTIETRQRRAPA